MYCPRIWKEYRHGPLEAVHQKHFYVRYMQIAWIPMSLPVASQTSTRIVVKLPWLCLQEAEVLFTVCGAAPGFVSSWHCQYRLCAKQVKKKPAWVVFNLNVKGARWFCCCKSTKVFKVQLFSWKVYYLNTLCVKSVIFLPLLQLSDILRCLS